MAEKEIQTGGSLGAANPAKGGSVAGRILKFLIPPVVSVGLCVVMFRDINFGEMLEVINGQCDFRWIALMLVMGLFPIALRALRWGIQLRALGVATPAHVLFYSIFGTYSVNLVFPRLGEVWRTTYVSFRQDAPFSEVFGSMIADRFADLITVGCLTLLTFVVAREPLVDFVSTYPAAYEALLRLATSPWLWGAVVACIAAAWWLLARSNNRFVLKVKGFLSGLWNGFAALARMRGKMQWLGLTVCVWGCYFLQLVIAFQAFPMTRAMLADNGAVVALLCFVLTSISMGIPSNGGIGPYQTTMLFGLGLFVPAGMSHHDFMTTGAAFGNVIIASQTLLLIVGGVVVFALIALDKRRRVRHQSAQ